MPLKALDLKTTPLEKDTLNSFEKVKLKLLESIFSSNKNNKGTYDVESKGIFKWLHNNTRNNKNSKWKQDFEKLLFRNQKETDKLLNLFKSNPNLALLKAIPLDTLGTSRESGNGVFNLLRGSGGNTSEGISPLSVIKLFGALVFILFLFNSSDSDTTAFFKFIVFVIVVILVLIYLFNPSGDTHNTSGNVSLDSKRLNALRNEYEKMAEQCIQENDYKKAASIYIKLLQDYNKAAKTLEDGKFYQEAAVIYLKYSKNKEAAAKAYEEGKFYNEAIAIYKELHKNEKVGDLYKLINNQPAADEHYQLVINNYIQSAQYVKASLIYKYKIEDVSKAQDSLLKGWQENKDAYNCLNNYFSNIENEKLLMQQIQTIYKEETDNSKVKSLLRALKIEHEKSENLKKSIKDLSYEIIANHIQQIPDLAFSLNSFNNDNTLLNTDINRFVKVEKKKK